MPPRRPVGRRLLTVLQLTRAALVYTAVSNGLASLALRARWEVGPGGDLLDFITAPLALATVAVAAGLYGFGMSLNDIIDRRRDAQLAPTRPLPGGRIGVGTAHAICGALRPARPGRRHLPGDPRPRGRGELARPARHDGADRLLRRGGQVPGRPRPADAGPHPLLPRRDRRPDAADRLAPAAAAEPRDDPVGRRLPLGGEAARADGRPLGGRAGRAGPSSTGRCWAWSPTGGRCRPSRRGWRRRPDRGTPGRRPTGRGCCRSTRAWRSRPRWRRASRSPRG